MFGQFTEKQTPVFGHGGILLMKDRVTCCCWIDGGGADNDGSVDVKGNST